ncbi:MAG TPA: M56 family metallopeptidase [Candidatus Acidoferrales bacterium]|nr:M56 family metallopeptidase [Candidatus Acidoferrales bacterium]
MMANSLVGASSGFLVNLAEPAVRSLGIGCLAAAALAAFRVKRVSLRLFVWTLVLYVALAMPFLGALLPRLPFTLPGAARAEQAAQKFARSFETSFDRGPARTAQHVTAASSTTLIALTNSTAIAIRGSANALQPSGEDWFKNAAATSSKPAPTQRFGNNAAQKSAPAFLAVAIISHPVSAHAAKGPAPPRTIPWMTILLAAYGTGAFVLLLQLLLGLYFSGRLARGAAAIADSRALRILRYRACFGGLEKTPRLTESEALAVPATIGVLRPVILLPVDWREWDDAKLDAVLAHEVSHVARRDALTLRLALVHRVIFWFSPLSWWINRQIAELAEEASDEAALAGGADRASYAETLLEFFAQREAESGRIYWQGVSMANGLGAARRVDRILSWNGANSMKKWLLVFVAAVAAPLIFVAGAAHPFITHAQDKTPVPPKSVAPPVAPVLAKAPNGGVAAPALAPAPATPGPEEGVENPGPMPPAPSAGVAAPAPMAQPSFPLAPPAMSAMPSPALAPMPPAPSADPFAALAPQASDQDIAEQMRATEEALKAAQAQLGSNSAQIRAAQRAAEKAAKIIDARMSSQMREAREALAEADREIAEAERQQSYGGNYKIRGDYNSGGGRYVILSGKDSAVEMSGDDEDLQHARALRQKLGKDLIWFERDEKSYVITDPAFIAQAKALFAPEDELSKQEDELSRQQDALSKQQDALGEKMDAVKVKVPDISPELQRVKAELDALRANGGTQSDLGRIQSELGRLQSEVGRFQSDAGVQQSEIGRQQGELGRQQGELGRKQGEIGQQQGEIARKASRQLRDMFGDAIAKGIAKPE